ncbi:hypothetical protein [Pontibacter oryzae]|uniref:Uncharacterized protein n=1 Tax=Pontibacter oryzae TaxID=2304593 RepID=A0A399S2S1_9BACT|nr:hypothetical protein [Pontibacter oryzae]RIJ36739.1 hypothetical protein D1627_12945 [Pontibacter oryzae]
MKGEKNKNWEFNGFASNPEKSYEAGKKGSRLAVEASLRNTTPQAQNTESKSVAKPSAQNKNESGKGWQSVPAEGKANKSATDE